ncbi:hypothetical protein H4Q26_003394 [Puccinia striiformis f. sp. tritici PST-130]|nr:hypothetical protein H4Q26_003394 [Puccinia striiformis f. sp. tritici PST-130]
MILAIGNGYSSRHHSRSTNTFTHQGTSYQNGFYRPVIITASLAASSLAIAPNPDSTLKLLRSKGMANVIDRLFAGARLKCCCRLDACESPTGEMDHHTTLKSVTRLLATPSARNSRF